MESLERHWGVVFQDNALFPGFSVEANIALPLREVQHLDESTITCKVREVLREVALDPETNLDLNVDQLSGGMAMRASLALNCTVHERSRFARKNYFYPDLDPLVAEQIEMLIKSTHYKKTPSGFPRTSVLISHDKEMLYRLQPRIIMLDDERIIFDGTYGDFQNSGSPIIRPYFELMPRLHSRTPGAA
jgi:phospholipid/cholesterol/gamma-HCH transport system ATP-binding protein